MNSETLNRGKESHWATSLTHRNTQYTKFLLNNVRVENDTQFTIKSEANKGLHIVVRDSQMLFTCKTAEEFNYLTSTSYRTRGLGRLINQKKNHPPLPREMQDFSLLHERERKRTITNNGTQHRGRGMLTNLDSPMATKTAD